MPLLYCMLCDHESNGPEIVNHINTVHDGLEDYLQVFQEAQVATDTASLSETDRALIEVYKTAAKPIRSEIIIS